MIAKVTCVMYWARQGPAGPPEGHAVNNLLLHLHLHLHNIDLPWI